jgi:hypothetical protein
MPLRITRDAVTFAVRTLTETVRVQSGQGVFQGRDVHALLNRIDELEKELAARPDGSDQEREEAIEASALRMFEKHMVEREEARIVMPSVARRYRDAARAFFDSRRS